MAKVYISSTYLDLKDHRKRVYDQLRKSRHDVISMEDYNPDTRPPLKKCIADVKNADIYVGLIGWRYGYIPDKGNPENLSITEHEYKAAIESGKEIVLFLVDKTAPWPPTKMDAHTDEGPERINALRAQMGDDHIVGFFSTPDDLAAQLSPAIEEASAKISPDLPKDLLENLSQRFGHDNPDAPPEELTQYLKDKAKDYKALQSQLDALKETDKRIENLVGTAKGALSQGQFEEAQSLYADAREIQRRERTEPALKQEQALFWAEAESHLFNDNATKAAESFEEGAKGPRQPW